MDPECGRSLQYDIAEQITQLLQCDATLKSLRGVSREWKGLATQRVRHLRPRAGQKGGALDLAMLAERFPHVETLNLYSVSGIVGDECLAPCSKIQHLRGVVLDGCKNITNDGLKHLHTGIQSLSLRNCSQVTWAGLSELTNLPNLTALNIAGIKLAAAPGAEAAGPAAATGHFQNIAAAPELPAQAPAGPGNAGAVAFPSGPMLSELLHRLESLIIGDPMALSFIADRMVVEELAAVRPSRLTHLDLSGCIDLTDWAVHELCFAIPSLTSLGLQSCVRLTNVSILELGRLPRLRALNLRGCLQLNDAGISAGLSALSTLEDLNLQGCTSITGSCISDLAHCKSLAVLNVSHCTAFSSLEPLRSLAGLQRLDVSHCSKLSPGRIIALTALSRLTEIRASHLRYHSAQAQAASVGAASSGAAAAAVATPPQALDQLSALASLEQLQALDLSYMNSQGGVPVGLLDAVAALTRLTRLNLAGCGGPGCGGPGCGFRSGLGFLSNLRRLQDLDLGSWQEVDPHELACLAGATALRRLVVSRLGNRHATACFEGCDCGGSAASSIYPSPFHSPVVGSPPSSTDGVPGAAAAEAVAAPAEAAPAEARAELAARARARACIAALDAAASMVMESGVESRRGSAGGSSGSSCDGSSSSSCDGSSSSVGSNSSGSSGGACTKGGASEEPISPSALSPGSSCWTPRLGSNSSQMGGPLPSELDTKLFDFPDLPVQQPFTARCSAAASGHVTQTSATAAAVDALSRQMAAVGITCSCAGRRGGPCAGAPSGMSRPAAILGIVAAAAAVPVSMAVAATTAPATAPAPASVAAASSDTFGRMLAGVRPVAAPLPCLAAAATAAAAARAGLDGLLPMPVTPRAGLDGALGHLTGLTALVEIHLEACNYITDEGVARLALLPRLELLDLGGCNRITGRTLGAFATQGSLHTLLLGNCASLTDKGVVAASSIRSLRVVDVSGCNRLSDEGSVALGALRRLSRLSLRSNSKCSDRTVEALSLLPSLQWLCLSLCGVTDDSLQFLAASRSLTWLDLSHCWRLSRGAVRQLEAVRPQLKVIFSGRG